MKKDILEILNTAVYAPSGDNCQPWKFVLKGNKLLIFNLPQRDTSLYSWGQRASYLAHGALIENIAILSSQKDYEIDVSYLPSNRKDLVASIIFKKNNVTTRKNKLNSLAEYIFLRTTNRKSYKEKRLSDKQLNDLINLSNIYDEVNLKVIRNAHGNKIAKSASKNEKILFENKYLHSFLFQHINWTEKEDRRKKIGFYIKTFELPLPGEIIFRLVKNIKLLQLANRIGLSKFIANENAKVYDTATYYTAVTIDDSTETNYILAGRVLQRAWLMLTSYGLSAQPLAGIVYLMLKVKYNDTEELETKHIEEIISSYNSMANEFEISNDTIAMILRVGLAEEPSAKALRLRPRIL